jgi:uncharacterized protein
MINPKHNVVGWFEIPVLNMERAIKFYEKVFDIKMDRQMTGALDSAWFPWVEEAMGAGGSLVLNEKYKPSGEGIFIYFTAMSGNLDNELSRVEGAGGKIAMPRTLISKDIGYMGVIIDTEGNKIAVHSRE